MISRRPHMTREWSLGAVLAEREVDPRTSVLVVRADAGAVAAMELRRRLIGLSVPGDTTVIVDLNGADHVTDAVLAALMQGRRTLVARGGRLVLAASDASLQKALERLGFDLDGALETT